MSTWLVRKIIFAEPLVTFWVQDGLVSILKPVVSSDVLGVFGEDSKGLATRGPSSCSSTPSAPELEGPGVSSISCQCLEAVRLGSKQKTSKIAKPYKTPRKPYIYIHMWHVYVYIYIYICIYIIHIYKPENNFFEVGEQEASWPCSKLEFSGVRVPDISQTYPFVDCKIRA